MNFKSLEEIGEYGIYGMYENPERSLFFRKAMGMRRYYENCPLPEYKGAPLYPSGVAKNTMAVYPDYRRGMEINYQKLAEKNKELADLLVSEFYRYTSSVPMEHSVAGNMFIHSIPNYERILKEGLVSYAKRVTEIEDYEIRDGLLNLIEGIKNYVKRCTDYLESVKADEKLISALKKVPLYPAEDIYEAVVGWNFILYLDNCDNLGCVASGLLPYYNGENIVELLKNLCDNIDANNGYSMALGAEENPLTIQCLEASKGKRRPMIELLVNEQTPREVWEKAFEVIRTNNGQPAFYNEKLIINGLKERFPVIKDEDLKKFCGGGCTESMLAGLSNVGSLDAGINLLLIFEKVLKEKLEVSSSFEEFYHYYMEETKAVVEKITTEISNSQKERAKFCPLPMRTLLIDDCIEKGLDYNNGGARYRWSIINFAGMINVIDSMLVIRDFVFEEKSVSANEMLEKLEKNDIDFLKKCRNHKISFGNDNDDANAFSSRISKAIFSMLDNKKPYLGEGFLPASIQFMSQVDAGKNLGATPDGREKGEPLCDSLGAIFGKDINGPTALLKSVTSLDLKRALGIPVLNFNIAPDFKDGVLKALILGYMKLGGIQMQITCSSAEMLMEAYEKPDLHKNLVVRVGGYSEYFNNLSDELKKMIIERSIQKME
ncbi:MAG: hypothetical protein E7415_01135 [Ruminococcaceae bacterium]|nr:hypothetical protein [Oscillospiraceae bacterium]